MVTGRLALEAAPLLAGVVVGWRLPRVGERRGTTTDVSIVVPARNEEAALPLLLASLAAQADQPCEVVVVDDGSTDATAAVAAGRPGVRVLAAPPRPDGWNGKQWACHVGASAATGSTLCFLDADVRLDRPDSLARLVGEHDGVGILSVEPYHRTERRHEGLSAVAQAVSVLGAGVGRRRPTGLFGPCLVVHRATYDAFGGHEAVRGAVMEDVAMASAARRAGVPVRVCVGRGCATFRMYPDGARQVLEGWTRGLGSGVAAVAPLTLALVVLWVAGLVGAPVALVARDPGVGLAAAVYAGHVALLAWVLRRLGRFPRGTALVFPAALVLFLVAFARGLVATLTGRPVRWKGRPVRAR